MNDYTQIIVVDRVDIAALIGRLAAQPARKCHDHDESGVKNSWRHGIAMVRRCGPPTIVSMRVVMALVAACTSGCLVGRGDQIIWGTAVLTASGEATRFDNSMIVVCGVCAADAPCDCTGVNSAPVAADGSYTIDRGARGPNKYTASAPSTLEGSVAFTVDGSGDVEAPPLVLTPLGDVTGTVTGLTVLAGVVVTVDGSSVTATTDALGTFTLAGVLSGPETLTAFQPGSPQVVLHAGAVVPYASAVTVALDFSTDPASE